MVFSFFLGSSACLDFGLSPADFDWLNDRSEEFAAPLNICRSACKGFLRLHPLREHMAALSALYQFKRGAANDRNPPYWKVICLLTSTAQSMPFTCSYNAAARSVEGGVRRACQIQGTSNSHGPLTKPTFRHRSAMLTFTETGRAL